MIEAGTRLGAYEIVSPLGAGGMSTCGHSFLRRCEQAVDGRSSTNERRAVSVGHPVRILKTR